MNDIEFLADVDLLLREAANKLKGETLQDDDLTYERISARHGVTRDQARRIARLVLEPLVEAGKYVKVRCRNPAGGNPLMVYRPVTGKANGKASKPA